MKPFKHLRAQGLFIIRMNLYPFYFSLVVQPLNPDKNPRLPGRAGKTIQSFADYLPKQVPKKSIYENL